MTPEDALKTTQNALAMLERMMLQLYLEKAKYHPQQYYAMMAPFNVDHIRQLRAQIDEAIGLNDYDRATAAYDDEQAANGHADESPAEVAGQP